MHGGARLLEQATRIRELNQTAAGTRQGLPSSRRRREMRGPRLGSVRYRKEEGPVEMYISSIRVMPALEAGIVDHVWTLTALLA